MLPTLIELFSVLLLLVHYYRKTKDKIVVWVLSYLTFLVCSGLLFRKLFPNIPFVSPTPEYMVFLAIVGIPFLVLILFLGVEADKRKSREEQEEKKGFAILFTPSKDNIIFWAIFVMLNLAAFLMRNNK